MTTSLVVALVLAHPAVGQGVFDMGSLTNTLSVDAVTQSERARARQIRKGIAGAAPPRLRRTADVSAAAFGFRPDPALRRRHVDEFVAGITKLDPANGKQLAKDLRGDPIAKADPALARYGMRTSNVADAMTFYLVTAWQTVHSRANEVPPRTQVAGVRGQMAAALARTGLAKSSNAAKQEVADPLVLRTFLIDAAATRAKGADRGRVAAAIRQGVRASYGLDLGTLRLTNRGLVR